MLEPTDDELNDKDKNLKAVELDVVKPTQSDAAIAQDLTSGQAEFHQAFSDVATVVQDQMFQGAVEDAAQQVSANQYQDITDVNANAVPPVQNFTTNQPPAVPNQYGPPPVTGNAPVTGNVYGALQLSQVNQNANPDYRTRLRKRCLMITGVGIVVVGGLTSVVLGMYYGGVFGAGIDKNKDNSGTPTEPPATPSDVTAVADGADAILVSWVQSPGTTGYEVFRDGKNVGTPANTAASFRDTGLTAGTQYCYTVTAVNSKGTSKASDPACTTIPVAPPQAPDVPANLTATAKGADTILLMWSASPFATSYTLKRRLATDTSAGAVIATVPAGANPLSYTDTGLKPTTGYSYTVSAENVAGSSGDSGFETAYTFDATRMLAEKVVDAWNKMSEGAFWDSMIAWQKSDTPSGDVQLNVAMYTYAIADRSNAPKLAGETAINAAAKTLGGLYSAKTGMLPMYQDLKTKTVNGQSLYRYEKLNLLARALGLLISPNAT